MRRPAAILFDLDETLITSGDRRLQFAAGAAAIAPQLTPLTAEAVAWRLEHAFQAFWGDPARHATWRQNISEARRRIVEAVFARLADQGAAVTASDAPAFVAAFEARRDQDLRILPGVIPGLRSLRAGGVGLALVSNGAADAQRRKIGRTGVGGLFDVVQIEGEAGFGKPDPRAYQAALAGLGVTAGRAWMVGDHLEWDVAAPQRLGLFGVWHDHVGRRLPEDQPIRPDLTVRSMPELVGAFEASGAACEGRHLAGSGLR